MIDLDTFLTTLYVIIGDFCKSRLPAERRQGPKPSLCLASLSETLS